MNVDEIRREFGLKGILRLKLGAVIVVGSLIMVLTVAFIVGMLQANIAADNWNHSIATRLNPEEAGSDNLRDLRQIQDLGTWIAPLTFGGLALVLSGISLAFATIVMVLRCQSGRLVEITDSTASQQKS